MARPTRLKDVQVITFDCYGTLIDWESGAKQTLRELLTRHEVSTDEDVFFRAWERVQWVRIHQSYACYRDIVAESFLEVVQRYGLPCTEADAAAFATAIPHWPPFPEVPQALAALKHRLRLGIISNIDDDLLAGSVAQLGVDFDFASHGGAGAHLQASGAAFPIGSGALGAASKASGARSLWL